jgi:WD40 repeat protein
VKFQVALKYHLPAHKDSIYTCLKLDDTSFLTAGGDGQLLKWDLKNTKSANLIAKTDHSIYFLEHINSHTIAIGTNSGELYFYDHEQKRIVEENNLGKGIFTGVVDDGKLIVGSADGLLSTISIETNEIIELKTISDGHLRTISKLSSGLIAVGTSANEIIFLNQNQEIHRINRAHNDSVFSLLGLDDNYFISGGKDAMLKLWDLKSYKPVIDVPAHLFAVNHIIRLGKQNRIITASRDKSIKIWDPETLLLNKVIDRGKIELASSHSVNKLLWLNNDLLVAVGDDRIVRIYQITEV